MRYRLSKLIPVHFHTVYRRGDATGQSVFASWWQWRGHIFRHTAIDF